MTEVTALRRCKSHRSFHTSIGCRYRKQRLMRKSCANASDIFETSLTPALDEGNILPRTRPNNHGNLQFHRINQERTNQGRHSWMAKGLQIKMVVVLTWSDADDDKFMRRITTRGKNRGISPRGSPVLNLSAAVCPKHRGPRVRGRSRFTDLSRKQTMQTIEDPKLRTNFQSS
jgi:hypothetical protein